MTPRRRLALLLVLLAGVAGGATALQRAGRTSNAEVPGWAHAEFEPDAPRYAGRRLRLDASAVTFISGVEAPQVLPIEAVTLATGQGRADAPVLDLHVRDGEAPVQLRVAFDEPERLVRLATMPDVRWRLAGTSSAAAPAPAAAPTPAEVPAPASASAAPSADVATPGPSGGDSVFIVCCVDAAGRPSRSGLPAIFGVPVRRGTGAAARPGADAPP